MTKTEIYYLDPLSRFHGNAKRDDILTETPRRPEASGSKNSSRLNQYPADPDNYLQLDFFDLIDCKYLFLKHILAIKVSQIIVNLPYKFNKILWLKINFRHPIIIYWMTF